MKQSDKHNLSGLLALAMLAAVLMPLKADGEKPNDARDAKIEADLINEILGKLAPKADPAAAAKSRAEKTIQGMIDEILQGRIPRTDDEQGVGVKHTDRCETAEERRMEKLLAERGLHEGNDIGPTVGLIRGAAQQFVGILSTSAHGYNAMMDAVLLKKLPVADYEVTLKRIVPLEGKAEAPKAEPEVREPSPAGDTAA